MGSRLGKYPSEDVRSLIVATIVIAVVSGVFIFPLPPAAFFDGFGRIVLIYLIGGLVIGGMMSEQSRNWKNIVQGSLGATFFGSLLGLVVEAFLR